MPGKRWEHQTISVPGLPCESGTRGRPCWPVALGTRSTRDRRKPFCCSDTWRCPVPLTVTDAQLRDSKSKQNCVPEGRVCVTGKKGDWYTALVGKYDIPSLMLQVRQRSILKQNSRRTFNVIWVSLTCWLLLKDRRSWTGHVLNN